MSHAPRARVIALTLASLGVTALLAAAPGDPPKPESGASRDRVLIFSKTAGFRHQSIPDGIKALREILGPRLEIEATEDAKVFAPDSLKRFKCVIFLSTTGDILNEEQQSAFEAYIRAGGGYAGVHAAADTEHTWPWYGELVGAYFKTHPDIQLSTVKVEDRTHPSTRMLPAEWRRTDEWYVYNRNPRDRVRVLASLDDSTVEGADMGGDHPIAWYHEFQGGRAWYTGGGHTTESFSEDLFRKHLEGGVLWAAGLAETAPGSETSAPANPSPVKPANP